MPDVRKCAIYGCRSNSRDHKDLKFFNFPARDSPLYNTWLSICHESEETLRVIRRPYICSNHFHPWHVGFRRLAIGAVPTLLLKAPPGFAEEELARAAEENAAVKEKERLLKLINDSLYKWIERAQHHPDIGHTLCTSRRELQRVGMEIRNLLGATLKFHIDDYWLRKFRKSHLSDWDYFNGPADEQTRESLDLVEIIKSVDPDAKISSEKEIEILVDDEQKIAGQKEHMRKSVVSRTRFEHCPPLSYFHGKTRFQEPKKRSFKETLEEFYGIGGSKNNNSRVEVKSETMDSVDLSQDDDGCFDVYSEGPQVVSEPIVETYQQALHHLKPLEDFAFRRENYRVIGLLTQLEIILKNHRPTSTA